MILVTFRNFLEPLSYLLPEQNELPCKMVGVFPLPLEHPVVLMSVPPRWELTTEVLMKRCSLSSNELNKPPFFIKYPALDT